MKNMFLSIVVVVPMLAVAQPKKNKNSAIAPIYEPGWYLPTKGDTIKGDVQTNVGATEAQWNVSFFFKGPKAAKAQEIKMNKAKAYGFSDKKFEILTIEEQQFFAQVLEKGRLTLYMIYEEKEEKDKKIAKPIYYMIDNQADPKKDKTAKLMEVPHEKPYKRALKEFFKDQPMLLENVDKWFLNIDQVKQAVQEFNRMYPAQSGN